MMERITWLDSCSTDHWHNPQLEDYSPLKCVSVGTVLKDTKECVALAASIESETQVCQVMIIPKAVITKREKLTASKRRGL